MNIGGDGYSMTYEGDVITISGKFSLMPEAYGKIETFFERIVRSGQSEITLDMRNLRYLNSSGIKAICVGLILKAAGTKGFRMKILCLEQNRWQKETVPSFKGLMDDMEIVFK